MPRPPRLSFEPSEALAEIMRRDRDREDEAPLPFGASSGELIARRAEPLPPPPEPLRIEPADWETEVVRVEQEPAPEPGAPLRIEPPPWSARPDIETLFAPPAAVEPLRQPPVPEVDWREELEERAQRAAVERAAAKQAELEAPREPYPAKRRRG